MRYVVSILVTNKRVAGINLGRVATPSNKLAHNSLPAIAAVVTPVEY